MGCWAWRCKSKFLSSLSSIYHLSSIQTASWWSLPQDERRRIFEEQSKHINIGLQYLPAIARRLHHCRDLGENEPFDFLTWFEYAPSDETAFNKLVSELRATKEWAYVDREIDIRVVRDGA